MKRFRPTSPIFTLAPVVLSTLFACGKPERPPVPTLESPAALAIAQWCNQLTGTGAVQYLPASACASPVDITSRVAVANTGRADIQLVSLDTSRPAYVDLDPGEPGNTGIDVPDGPSTVAVGLVPTVALVGSSREPALSAVDVVQGVPVGQPLRLSSPPQLIRNIPGTNRFIFSQRLSPALGIVRLDVSCDGEAGVHRSDCTLTGGITLENTISLDAPPASFAVGADGRVFVTRDGQTSLLVVDLALDPSGAPSCSSECDTRLWSLTADCRDGIDNDGDGLSDFDDPQCFDPDGSEFVDDASICSDGLDNDGDGLVDADDPDCLTPQFGSEEGLAGLPPCANGFDDDLDGLTDGEDPGCVESDGASEFERGVRVTPSEEGPMADCRDGIDNDGDGQTDWPEETECYAAWSESESAIRLVVPSEVALTDDSELVLVADVSGSQLLVFDAASGERLAPNETHPLYARFLGIPLSGNSATSLVTYSFDIATRPLTDGRRLRVQDQVAHVALTAGFADPLVIARRFIIEDAQGNIEQQESDYRLSRTDLEGNAARVRLLTCDVPTTAFDALGSAQVACGDERLPHPTVVNPDAVGDTELTAEYTTMPADAYLALPQLQTWRVRDDETGIEPTTTPDDYRTTEDNFRVVWEGRIPGTNRTDALVTGNGEYVELLGADPCTRNRDVCSIGLDFNECPQARALCAAGADLCSDELFVCRVCPQACSTAANFCQLGVVPGDRLVFERRSGRTSDPACEPFILTSNSTPIINRISAEYEVLAVESDRLQIGVVPDAASQNLVTSLPPLQCLGEPVPIVIRAAQSFLWAGDSTGHTSPFRAVGNVCVPRDDAQSRIARIPLDKPFTTPQQFTVNLESGTVAPVRDFSIRFDVRNGFVNPRSAALFFLLGPSTSDIVHTVSRQGHRVVFSDDAQNYIWVYNGATYQGVGGPLP